MTNPTQQSSATQNTAHTLHLTLVVNGQPYEAEVQSQEIFHEALEHALPHGLLSGHRIRISTPNGDEVFPDMFIGESAAHFKTATFHVEAKPLPEVTAGTGKQTWTNFGDAAYRHLAHHAQLRRERVGDGSGSIASDFTLLERNERWSLYCHYRNGHTRLMIQLSEIKPEERGFANPHSFTDHMYDYLSGRYGVRFEETAEN